MPLFSLIPQGEYVARATTMKKLEFGGWTIAYTIEQGEYTGRQVFGRVEDLNDTDGDIVGRSFNIKVTYTSPQIDARTGQEIVHPKAEALSRIGGPAGRM